MARRHIEFRATIESDSSSFLRQCLIDEPMISFQLPLAFAEMEQDPEIRAMPLHAFDIGAGALHVAQHSNRALSVAYARFATALMDEMDSMSAQESSAAEEG
jgi:hypothetical protein